MKRFNGIVESEFAPASTMDMWLFKGNLKYFGPEGWQNVGSSSGSSGLSAEDIVNNLTEGGATKVLSAEQGKVLGNDIATLKTTPENIVGLAGPNKYGLIKTASSDLTGLQGDATLADVIQAVNDLINTLRGINILV